MEKEREGEKGRYESDVAITSSEFVIRCLKASIEFIRKEPLGGSPSSHFIFGDCYPPDIRAPIALISSNRRALWYQDCGDRQSPWRWWLGYLLRIYLLCR